MVEQMHRFARVAVGIALEKEFDYGVPEEHAERIAPGMRVLVPFGPRRITGYVTALPDQVDYEGRLKPILDLLDDAPSFNAPLLELLRFAADYYRVPLGELMRKALPPSMHAAEKVRIRLTDAGRERLQEHPILEAFAGPRPKSLRQAREMLPQRQLDDWLADGTLEELRSVETGGPGEATRRVVRIARYDADAITGPAQQELVDYVLSKGSVPTTDLKAHFKQPDRLVRLLAERGILEVEEVRVFRNVTSTMTAPPVPEKLNAEQLRVLQRLAAAVEKRTFHPFLLHGVTGSGKTEVYLRTIERVLKAGRQALVLVPEIALTPQLMAAFEARFGDRVAILHSALGPGERYDQWCQVALGRRPIVLGARSAIFAPLQDLGLIVVDEEHEPSFKQDERPFYNARDLALVRARQAGAAVILGSATPSLESHLNAETSKYERLELLHRATPRPLPDVVVVDLRETPFVDDTRVFSRPLAKAVQERLDRGEQTILFLNRKGFAAFLLCEACGGVPRCPNCDISLTLYKRSGILRCHYCQFGTPAPSVCPTCGAEEALKEIGTGTERATELLEELFPAARIARLDSTTSGGRRLTDTLSAFRNGELDILIGTQIIAKGHDFPGVTLVGVLLADLGLSFPDFRASERTFQLLTQVAGRAGRGETPGQVFVQTYLPTHYALAHAQRHDFQGFARDELIQRRMRRYPPYASLALFRFSGPDLNRVREAAEIAADGCRTAARTVPVDLLGPGMAPISYLRNRYRMQLLVRAPGRAALQKFLQRVGPILGKRLGRSPNLRWDVDVDPTNLM